MSYPRRLMVTLSLVTSVLCTVFIVTYAITYVRQPEVRAAGRQDALVESMSISELDSRCSGSLDVEGYAETTIAGRIEASGERGKISTPCRIHLAPGTSFELDDVKLDSEDLYISTGHSTSVKLENVELRTGDFYIGESRSNAKTRVVVSDSSLEATGDHLFTVNLLNSADSATIHNSTVDYSAGVDISIKEPSESTSGGDGIVVSDSLIRADDTQAPSGIRLTAASPGGEARFENVTFDVGDPNYQPIVLFADRCEAENMEGYPDRCSTSPLLEGPSPE